MSEETKPTPPEANLNDTQPTPPRKPLHDPQILTAIITGIVSVLVAVLGVMPVIVNSLPKPTLTPTFTPTVVTAVAIVATAADTAIVTLTLTASHTALVASETQPVSTALPPLNSPTSTQSATETTVPTALPPTAAPSDEPAMVITIPTIRATVMPTETFTPTFAMPETNVRLFINAISFTVLNTSGTTLSFEGVEFVSEKRQWDALGWGQNIHDRLPDENCLRLRDVGASPQDPPAACDNLFGLMIVGSTALFWQDVAEVNVMLNGAVIATCPTTDDTCDIYLPQ